MSTQHPPLDREILFSRKHVLTAEQFLNLSSAQKEDIESVHIVPPKLGAKDSGSFLVIFKTHHSMVGP